MAKTKPRKRPDVSFNFGANVKPKGRKGGGTNSGGGSIRA